MSKVQFCYDNLIDRSATVITPSTENALFPASNLTDYRSTKVYRSTASPANVVFDFGSALGVDTLIVRAHTTTGVGFTGSLTIEANSSNSWGAPAYTTTLDCDATYKIGFKNITTQTYRYWRVVATGASYVELSNLFIGQKYEPYRNISRDINWEIRDLSSFVANEIGQRFITTRPNQKFASFKIKLMPKGEVEALWTMLDFVGRKKPFYILFDPDELYLTDKERFSGMYFLESRPQDDHVIRGMFNFSFRVAEAI